MTNGVIICLGYILGLLLSEVPWGGFLALLAGVVGYLLFRRRRFSSRTFARRQDNSQALARTTPQQLPTIPHPRIWVIAGLVGLLASLYLQLRVPKPEANDISKFVPLENGNPQEQLFIIRGEVLSVPRITRKQRGQFWLEATQLDEVKRENSESGTSKGVTGKLYVTVPLLQATGLYPTQQIAITGTLYKPKPALNPGAFNFQRFLKQEGAFAGLSGQQVTPLDEERKWGWWKIRERIVQSQVRPLGIPEGPLVSAMVMGNKSVDLPHDIRDSFYAVGLAHILAASGFQTALIADVILKLTSKAKRGTQIILGSIALIIFLGLTGFDPPIVRAVIMGFAALIAIGLKRQAKQLGLLLVAAVLMLLFNPLWIWHLGFQLSFLSTLGLIVSATPIAKRLEWLPPAIAALIAVPLAASLWTLPLLLHLYGVVPVYGLIANILSTPLVSIVSLGGMASALASLILPDAGSAIAGFLYHPVHLLIQLVEFFANLPGSSIAVGSISLGQMLAIYTLLLLSWLVRWWQRRWWFATTIALGLVFIPVWHSANTLFQVTLLATGNEPVLVIQNQGKVTLVNSGDEETGRFTIMPFLRQQGINKIDWAIASNLQLSNNNSWLEILQHIPITTFYEYASNQEDYINNLEIQKKIKANKGIYQPLAVGQAATTNSVIAQLLDNKSPILQLQILSQNWLLIGNIKPTEIERLKNAGLPSPQVLWCSGQLLPELVPTLKPQVAIATSANLDSKTLAELKQSQTKLFFTGQEGAVQWTPSGQFQSFIQAAENKTSVL